MSSESKSEWWAGAAALAVVAGCATEGASPPPSSAGRLGAQPAQTAPVEFSPEAGLVYKKTLVIDPSPSCAELVAGLVNPLAALVEVADKAVAPGRASVRAASCVLDEHAEAGKSALLRWVGSKSTQGLGILVTQRLDRLPPALGEALARAALAGEAAEVLRPRVERTQVGRRVSGR